MRFRFLCVNVLIHCLTYFVGLQSEKSDCDKDAASFGVPYVRVYRKRNGESVESLDRSGFMDLTKYMHKIICLNGPAVLYKDVAEGSNDTMLFTKGTLETHIRKCVVFNQIRTEKAIELRDAKVLNPTWFSVAPEDIVGEFKFTAVYLISEISNYFLGTSVMFHQSDLNYLITSSEGVDDASFVTIGRGPFCLTVDGKFDVKIVPMDDKLTDTSLCNWSIDRHSHDADFNRRYDMIFSGNISRSKFKWTCGGGAGGGGGDTSGKGLGPYDGDGVTTTTTASPVEAIDLPPFATISKSSFFPRGLLLQKFGRSKVRAKSSDNSGPGGVFQRGEYTNWKTGGRGGGGNATDPWDQGDFLIEIDSSHCSRLPELPEQCKGDASGGNPEREKKQLFAKLFPIDYKSTTPTVLTDPPALEWKKDVLDVIAEIFGKVCEPFSKDVPFTVSRFFEYYLRKAYDTQEPKRWEKRPLWEQLTSELNRCNKAAKKTMLWYWDNRKDVEEPEIVDNPKCYVANCSDGCESKDRESCVPKSDLQCESDSPKCSAPCAYDSASAKCIDDSNEPGASLPGASRPQLDLVALRSDIEADDEESTCSSQIPTCTVPSCQAVSGICKGPQECKVIGCDPAEDCKTSFNGEKCESKYATLDSGANPSAEGSVDGEKTTVSSTGVESEPESDGTKATLDIGLPFWDPHNQEIIRVRPKNSYDFNGYPENVLVITDLIPKFTGRSVDFDVNTTTVHGQCIFFHTDMADTDYELNIAIDLFWKIWATVLGYCNSNYQIRKSETFPRLYNTFYEDFFNPLENDWKSSPHNEFLRIVLSSLNSENSQRWLDVCLESSYIVSNTSTYRPPRPLSIGEGKGASPQSNYFLQLPDYIAAKFQKVTIVNDEAIVHCN